MVATGSSKYVAECDFRDQSRIHFVGVKNFLPENKKLNITRITHAICEQKYVPNVSS